MQDEFLPRFRWGESIERRGEKRVRSKGRRNGKKCRVETWWQDLEKVAGGEGWWKGFGGRKVSRLQWILLGRRKWGLWSSWPHGKRGRILKDDGGTSDELGRMVCGSMVAVSGKQKNEWYDSR